MTMNAELEHCSSRRSRPPRRGCLAQTAAKTLAWALERYHPSIAFASSFGAEDVVAIDLILEVRPDARIFTLDTGRLNEETYEIAERIRRR
jgi:phosphoadenosine phosphosulfate reductase